MMDFRQTGSRCMLDDKSWDIFISHASEDKAAVAIPLANALSKAGLKVWLDQAELRMGDSLRGRISAALADCRFGVVILSPAFLAKKWLVDELRALIDLLDRWVQRGGGLLLMGCYGERHQASNFSELAWRFDLEFRDDLVLPSGLGDHEYRAHVFSAQPTWLATPQAARAHHRGRLTPEHRHLGAGGAGSLPAAHGQAGAEGACCRRKLWTLDWPDNLRLLDNILGWLGGG